MKNFYVFLLIAFFPLVCNAQIVDIPDAAFKNKLLNYPETIDLDEDGEIQVSEALNVTNLSFSYCNFDNIIGIQSFANLQTLNFGSYTSIASTIDLTGLAFLKSLNFTKCTFTAADFSGLTSLENLSVGYGGHINFLHFDDLTSLKTMSLFNTHIHTLDLSHSTNLKSFSAQNADLHTLTLDGLVNLEYFKCTDCDDLTSLNIDELTSLRYFELSDSSISTINFNNNILLEEVICGDNNFTALDFSNLTLLTTLTCYSNQLTALDVSNNINLSSLNCSNNQLTAIDLTHLHKLQHVDASKNLFTALDFSGLTEFVAPNIIYYIDDNPNLTNINIKNGKEDLIWTRNDLHCSNLSYMCLDDIDISNQDALLQLDDISNIQINTYCSFVPGGNYNTITGTFTLDNDNNGCDENDTKFSNGQLEISNPNQNSVTHTNTSGNYNFHTQIGDFLITPKLENPYFTISPTSATLSFTNHNNNTQTQNFCVIPNGVHNDVAITILPLDNAKPGFEAHYRLIYKNKGNQTISGNIHLTFDDAVLDFVSAEPNINNQSLNELNWSYGNLSPFESSKIDFTLNVNATQNTGDVLHFNATINPISDDETIVDNTFALPQTVVDALNPNDKTCLEGSTITTEMVGDYLHYMIRFQNTGTVTADHIVVKDMIDTDKFDMSSLQLTSASHPQVTKIIDNKIEFQFEHINLPAESDDEPASHGYIAFKIKTKNNLENGDSVANKADIYFDYNFPMETNTATSTVALLGVNTFENTSVNVTPNPTKNIIHITSKDNITALQLFDVQGRIIETITANEAQIDFDLSRKTSGVYFVKIYTVKGLTVEKVVKE
ncbi:T9SS type A sorting domain-containing protein [Flavobacterium sp.]|uniref:DUF7619 domain-containing protein n=1 Tax=Flavobacterium sp. TaxID=239 RepID=UPI00286C1A77|nr:T9SS type A sorting domain-containing protein [Flavobacterium sp.]